MSLEYCPEDVDTASDSLEAPARVLLLDQRAFARAGFRAILRSRREVSVVGEAGNRETALRLWRTLAPDVVVAGVKTAEQELSSAPAQEALEHLERPLRLIALVDGPEEIPRTELGSGMAGVLLQRASSDELVSGIQMVSAGYRLIAPGQALGTPAARPDGLATRDSQRWAERIEKAGLTRREFDVIQLLALGMNNAEISVELAIGESTVKSHVRSMLAKLGLRNRIEAIIFSYRNGYGAVPSVAAGDGGRHLRREFRDGVANRKLAGPYREPSERGRERDAVL